MQRGIRWGITKTLVTLTGLFTCFCALNSRAASVGVGYYDLWPDPVYIKDGETVSWYEDDDFGPYIITFAGWGYFYTPGTVQFNGSGTYHYTAQSVFGGGSWPGTVYVNPNSPPTVTITTPTNNSIFTPPATFAFEAEPFDLDAGDIWDVEFWVGNEMIDDVFYYPYATTVTNLSAGTYTLKAIVWDYSYAKATNSVTITVMNPGPITLTGTSLSGGNFRFNATGLVPGRSTVLQSSTNVASSSGWVSISTNEAVDTTVSFTNAVVAGRSFFRVIQLP